MTVALADHDPLQVCVDAVLAAGLENRWLIRQLPSMLRAAGFEVRRVAEPWLCSDGGCRLHAEPC
jgi:hypothetical protein